MFVAIVLFMRYLLEDTIDLVGDIVALTIDTTDFVAHQVSTGYTQFPWSSIITPISIQLLSVGGFVALLAYLTASRPLLPTRQSLQDLLDEAVRKTQETEDKLLNSQRFTEKLQALYEDLLSQNKRLQVEKEQVIAEKDSTGKEIAESAKKIENLTTDLEVAESLNRRLERSRFTAQFSLQVAEKNADRLEQARKAADDKASKLTEELVKAEKLAVTAPRVTKQSREILDHTDCTKKAASLADQVDALQKALKTLQDDQDNYLRRQATETSALREALAEKEENHQALKKQVESLTIGINDRQVMISQLEESLAAKEACLQQAQADILDLTEQVEELNAAKGVEADLESVKVKSQRDEIEQLNGEVVALKAAYDAREVELMDASAAAMIVDNAAVEIQSKEIADLQDNVRQLQAALDQAQVALSAARPEGEEMDLEVHECDHTRCQQRELEQDGNLAKLQATSLAQEKKISELARQVREQEFRMQGNQATTTASPEAVSLEAAKLRKEKADNLARARRDSKKETKELEDSLRAKNLELKELASELQVEKLAAATRVESAIRERMAGAKKALEEMKVERDRSRTNNSSLLQRAVEAETALAECQGQRERSVAEAGRLMGQLVVVQGGAGASNSKKREMEEEEGDPRPSKISRPDS